MRRVVIESPLSGNVERNLAYARACMLDSLRRGEAPFASHILLAASGVLDDRKPEERRLGMEAGFVWGDCAELVAVYTNLGISEGMKAGIRRAELRGTPVEYRKLGATPREGAK